MPQCSSVRRKALVLMPRWLWFLPLVALTIALAVWGFRMGYVSAHMTETDAINHYANQYLRDRAAKGAGKDASISDCVAYPGKRPEVWLIVDCGSKDHDAAQRYIYRVNRYGGLAFGPRRHADDAAPQPLEPET